MEFALLRRDMFLLFACVIAMVFFKLGPEITRGNTLGAEPAGDVKLSAAPIHERHQVLAPRAKPHGKRCTADQIVRIASNRPVAKSNCPQTSAWMDPFIENSTGNPSALVVFIGCNKGYDVVAAARAWGNNESYRVKDMLHFMSQRMPGKIARGACWSGIKPDRPIASWPARRVDAYCIEPMASNFQNLADAFSKLGYLQHIRVLKAAMSSTEGNASFPQGVSGMERNGMSASIIVNDSASQGLGAQREDVVPVMTVDATILPELRGSDRRIDFLSIDTEGNDARVLLGSIHLLVEGRARYLEFEYHGINKWATSDLEDTVDLLDQLGFDCYFSGNQGQLWRLTGCWDRSYAEQKAWSNVACVLRSESSLHSRMEGIARAYY